jgi:hypothetical protein
MHISLTSSKASNWVDRGAPAVPVMQRVLAFFFDRHAETDQAWLLAAAQGVFGMVEADASDVQVAGYLKSVAREQAIEFPMRARVTSIALWHIAKAALVRDVAQRVMNSDLRTRPDRPPPLEKWLAERLLTPAELANYEAEGRPVFDDDSPYS